MMSCRKVTEIVEKSKMKKLSLSEVVSLKMHLVICSTCKDFKVFSNQLETLLESHYSNENSNDNEIELNWTISEKEELIRKLKEL